jgi:hypothetical protein
MKNNNDPKQIIYQGQQVDEPKQLSYKKKTPHQCQIHAPIIEAVASITKHSSAKSGGSKPCSLMELPLSSAKRHSCSHMSASSSFWPCWNAAVVPPSTWVLHLQINDEQINHDVRSCIQTQWCSDIYMMQTCSAPWAAMHAGQLVE